jgi:hypothetical protein
VTRPFTGALVALLLPACFGHEASRFYPEWTRDRPGPVSIAGCATIDGWVAKSGKEGLGLVVHLVGESPNGCSPAFASIEVRIGDRVHPAMRLPAAPSLRAGQQVFAYVPIAFDGNTAWNEEEQRHATITIVTTPTASTPIVWPITFVLRERFPCEEPPPRRHQVHP